MLPPDLVNDLERETSPVSRVRFPVQALPCRPDLDLGSHGRAHAAFIARRPPAVLDLASPFRRDRVLPVLPQPVAVKARVQVIPGKHLAVITFARSVPRQVNGIFCRIMPSGIRPGEAAQCDLGRLDPPVEREILAPAIEPGTVPPGLQDDAGDTPVAAGQQALKQRRLAIVIPEPDRLPVRLVRAYRRTELAQPAVHRLWRALGRPLEGSVRLGHETADRYGAPYVAPAGDLPAFLYDSLGQVRDR